MDSKTIALFSILCFVAAVSGKELTSLEALEILKMVQTSLLDLEKKVATAPAILDAIGKEGIDHHQFKVHLMLFSPHFFSHEMSSQVELDKYIVVLDEALAFNQAYNVETVMKWMFERVEAATEMIWPLRLAKVNLWKAKQALMQLDGDWKEANDKLKRDCDLTNEEQKAEVVTNIDMFVVSLTSLKEAIVRIETSVANLERYILKDDDSLNP